MRACEGDSSADEGSDACRVLASRHASRQPDSVVLDPDRQASLDLLYVYAAPGWDGRGEKVMSWARSTRGIGWDME